MSMQCMVKDATLRNLLREASNKKQTKVRLPIIFSAIPIFYVILEFKISGIPSSEILKLKSSKNHMGIMN